MANRLVWFPLPPFPSLSLSHALYPHYIKVPLLLHVRKIRTVQSRVLLTDASARTITAVQVHQVNG
ncbi:hypothetical protein ACLOJK_012738 [Asimina triloba]